MESAFEPIDEEYALEIKMQVEGWNCFIFVRDENGQEHAIEFDPRCSEEIDDEFYRYYSKDDWEEKLYEFHTAKAEAEAAELLAKAAQEEWDNQMVYTIKGTMTRKEFRDLTNSPSRGVGYSSHSKESSE